MTVAISAQGSKVEIDTGTGTPNWVQVKGVKSFSGFDGEASELDVTDLDSAAKEIRLGLVDNGKLSLDINVNTADPGQAACQAARISGSGMPFKITYPDASTDSFTAYVKAMPKQGGVDAVLSGSINLRISGAVTSA